MYIPPWLWFSSANTYLYLRRGDATSGTALHENDDHDGKTTSQITETLASGTYTVEATTYGSGTTGSFNLTIATGSTGTGPPTGNCESTVTSGPTPVQGGLGGVAITGRWVVGCDSVHRSGRNASYISFTQESPGQVIITLESSVDTYLYLLQGEGGSGTVLANNDDYDGGDGSDELTPTGPSHVAALEEGEIREFEISPEAAGLPVHELEAIKGGVPEANAAALRNLLEGEAGAFRDAALYNAAAALLIAERTENLCDGVAIAAEAIDAGRAQICLDRLVEITNRAESPQ